MGIVFIGFCWSFRQEIGASPVIATGARMESQSFRSIGQWIEVESVKWAVFLRPIPLWVSSDFEEVSWSCQRYWYTFLTENCCIIKGTCKLHMNLSIVEFWILSIFLKFMITFYLVPWCSGKFQQILGRLHWKRGWAGKTCWKRDQGPWREDIVATLGMSGESGHSFVFKMFGTSV